MAKDYNSRAHAKPKAKPKPRIGLASLLLAAGVLGLFIAFLVFVKVSGPEPSKENQLPLVAESKPAAVEVKKQHTPTKVEAKTETKPEAKNAPPKSKAPHFEFYTVLSGKEAVVSEHEIKTRRREERLGKIKDGHYVIQVDSFKSIKNADLLRAKLATMGMEAKVEKTKASDGILYLVKIGPFTQMESVDAVRTRLRKNGLDGIVIETASKKTASTGLQTAPIKPEAPISATPISPPPPTNKPTNDH
jgi:cell division protein FtsN